MTSGRLTLFESPLFLGFDHFEKAFERIRKSAGEGYPPYNIEQTGENALRITIAVAGFTQQDLDVQIENNQLMIRGRQQEDTNRIYLHRGIAARQFQRAFVLAEGMEVQSAALDNGLLHIDLVQILPEPNVRRINIRSATAPSHSSQTIDVNKNNEA
ncbi:MAG: Hsp20 family protein [Alphaproteobacteria bacterium]|nr:Hsp20 family protein [Alphaproteobacteria bacterium]